MLYDFYHSVLLGDEILSPNIFMERGLSFYSVEYMHALVTMKTKLRISVKFLYLWIKILK